MPSSSQARLKLAKLQMLIIEAVFYFVRTYFDSFKLLYQFLESKFCSQRLFLNYSGLVGRVDGNSDNRANSAFKLSLT